MKTISLIAYVIVVVLGVLLIADGLYSYVSGPDNFLLSLRAFKGVVGLVFVALAASYFLKSKE